MLRCPYLQAHGLRAGIEAAASAVIARNRPPQIVRARRIFRFAGLLRIVTHAGEDAVQQTRRYFVRENRFHRRHADPHFAPPALRGPHDRVRRDLWLKNWRDWLRAIRQTTLHPVELRRIERWKL